MDFAEPGAALRLLALGLLLASVPLSWVFVRHRGANTRARVAALTTLALFLTFDLIVFGAFTRLTDSGLGCPDWPGCYGHASPVGAVEHIAQAQAAMPTGPVTHQKAWIEMIHRYLAMVVGALILVLAVLAWVERKTLRLAPTLATATLFWVLVQGMFGKYTVTWKLQPAVVTAHLLGAMVLLGLLTWQRARLRSPLPGLSSPLQRGAAWTLALLLLQMALGAWVSTNYAVLACTEFPTCQGQWWPDMAWAEGFTLWRELGKTGDGANIAFAALVAIHWAHRLGAVVVAVAVGVLTWALHRAGERRAAVGLAALLVWQWASGLSNVVLGWPLVAALMHTAGAAALTAVLVGLCARSAAAAAERTLATPAS